MATKDHPQYAIGIAWLSAHGHGHALSYKAYVGGTGRGRMAIRIRPIQTAICLRPIPFAPPLSRPLFWILDTDHIFIRT
jgi:hypothetical protein